ncbi:cytochrome P450 6g1-like [Lutzomyia longipalpis]|uniref:cytochrome P450 6g1-like n=1 Tax=Lutzomyia longipalpis TaxID=7200 RepID=UPI002484386B|nr:cytochrome P450 6g1-like [Lutzomyia longipalpis]
MFVLEVILGLILCIGALLWWWQRSARLYWEKNGVSYIDGPPFIGALKDSMMFKKSFGELFLDIYNHEKFKDDPVTGVYFFHKPSLVIRHPELIKNILVKDFPNFIDRGVNSDPHDDGIGRDNLFSVKGQRWKTIRTKLSPVFTTGKLKNLFLLMMDVSKTLERKLQTEIGDIPKEYEMKEFASYFSTDTISICAFGVQANSLLNPNAEFHKNAKIAFDFKLKRAFQFCTCFFFPELAMFLRFAFFSRETNEFLRSSINYVMDERVKSGEKRNDLIDVLIAMKEEDSELFKGDTLVAQAAVFLLAGHETSSSATAFALYELARHPEVQEKVRKEIEDYIKKYGSIQYETINEMDYLNSVVQETLRLYPSLPFLDRICAPADGSDSYSLEPYHSFSIPRGMPVYIPHVSIQRDPKFYPNPLQFIPERFSSENRDSINQYAFLSFGIGPRNCIGSRFGYLQVKLALITILRYYRVEATERTPKSIEFAKKSLFVHSKEPLYMNLTRI